MGCAATHPPVVLDEGGTGNSLWKNLTVQPKRLFRHRGHEKAEAKTVVADAGCDVSDSGKTGQPGSGSTVPGLTPRDSLFCGPSESELLATWWIVGAAGAVDEKSRAECFAKLEQVLSSLDPVDTQNKTRIAVLRAGGLKTAISTLQQFEDVGEVVLPVLGCFIHLVMNDGVTESFCALDGVRVTMNTVANFLPPTWEAEPSSDAEPSSSDEPPPEEAVPNETEVEGDTKPQEVAQKQQLELPPYCYDILMLTWRLLFATSTDGTQFVEKWVEAGAADLLAATLKSNYVQLHQSHLIGWALGALRLLGNGTEDLLKRLVDQGVLGIAANYLTVYASEPFVAENAMAVLANYQRVIPDYAKQAFSQDGIKFPKIWESIVSASMLHCDDPNVVHNGLFALRVGCTNESYEGVPEAVVNAGGLTLVETILEKYTDDTMKTVQDHAINLQALLTDQKPVESGVPAECESKTDGLDNAEEPVEAVVDETTQTHPETVADAVADAVAE
eukprot:Selendium_serpulae@DN6172_c0_g1_i2.p1